MGQTKNKITWSPSRCRNASILIFRRETQAKLRLGWSQHGEKSLKFHSINSIVEYAKKKKKNQIFLKQKICKPRAQFIQRYNCVCPCCNPLVIHPHRWNHRAVAPSKSKQRKKTPSSIHLRSFFSLSWLNEDIFDHTNLQVHILLWYSSLNLQT